MGWKQRHQVVLTWVAAAMTPTVGSNRHWAVGSWCCLWVRVWDRAVVCPLAGFPPEDASLRPWAQRERRCSSGWPRLRLASPPSSPTRSRLARCHLHRRKRTAQLILWPDECFSKDFTGQGLILCLLNIQEPSSYNTKGWKPSCVCVLKSLLVKEMVQRKTNITLLVKKTPRTWLSCTDMQMKMTTLLQYTNMFHNHTHRDCCCCCVPYEYSNVHHEHAQDKQSLCHSYAPSQHFSHSSHGKRLRQGELRVMAYWTWSCCKIDIWESALPPTLLLLFACNCIHCSISELTDNVMK